MLRACFAFLICVIALLLPYRLRLWWFDLVAKGAHLPFRLFGLLARYLMSQTDSKNPYGDSRS